MEFASRLRWLIVITVTLLALVLIGWGLFSIANSLFRSGTDNSSQVLEVSSIEVGDTATATLIVDGPVVANAEHNSYTIEVSQNVVSMKLFSEYGQKLISEKSYQNTDEAFQTFLSSLDNLNIEDRIKDTDTDDDYAEQGVCSSGKRYIVELDNDIRRWNTSCSTKQGTAAGSMNAIRKLFQKQVPDYRDIVRGSGL